MAKPALARPVSSQQQIPLDFRRTTLVVQSLEASLRFYRDGLGMKVAYDQIIRTPREAPDDSSAERVLRLVLLEANDDFVGMLGLLEYLKPLREARPDKVRDGVLHPRDTVLLFNTRELDATFARASAMPGVTIGERPTPMTYPGYQGKGTIRVMFSSLYDPDGNFVELNQILSRQDQA